MHTSYYPSIIHGIRIRLKEKVSTLTLLILFEIKFHRIIIFSRSKIQCRDLSVVDPGGTMDGRALARDQIFVIFMRFSGKIGQNIRLLLPSLRLALPLRANPGSDTGCKLYFISNFSTRFQGYFKEVSEKSAPKKTRHIAVAILYILCRHVVQNLWSRI